MGLSFKSVGNFVSTNVKSAVKDSSRIAQQYVNNPITRAVAPTALSAIGVPPSVYNAVSNLQNKGLNSLQGIKNASSGSEYSEQIKKLNEQQYQAILKEIEIENQKIEIEKQKKEKEEKEKIKKTILIISGGIFLLLLTSFVTYKLLKKK